MKLPFLRLPYCLMFFFLMIAPFGHAGNGTISVSSSYSVDETITRLKSLINAKGLTLFKHIDHAAGAKKIGVAMPATQLLVFGNPKIGSKLMLCQPTIAIDLPLKAVVAQNAKGEVSVSYSDIHAYKQRHTMMGCDKLVEKVSKALTAIVQAATLPANAN